MCGKKDLIDHTFTSFKCQATFKLDNDHLFWFNMPLVLGVFLAYVKLIIKGGFICNILVAFLTLTGFQINASIDPNQIPWVNMAAI